MKNLKVINVKIVILFGSMKNKIKEIKMDNKSIEALKMLMEKYDMKEILKTYTKLYNERLGINN